MGRRCTSAAVAAFALLSAPARGQGFSTAPLSAPAAMPANSLAPTAVQFLGWLRTQDPATVTGREQLIREHLYALIAQSVRQRFAAPKQLSCRKGTAQSPNCSRGQTDSVCPVLATWQRQSERRPYVLLLPRSPMASNSHSHQHLPTFHWQVSAGSGWCGSRTSSWSAPSPVSAWRMALRTM